ncbi:MAG: arylesterase [Candidatus Omnitrophica bacterium]|nr:arylesterase [Candidatus Omnitrophota bacterium]
MKIEYRRSIYALTLLLAVYLYAGCTGKEIVNLHSKGKNIICFGDSISFGYGVDTGEDYPAVLSRLVTIPVINAGVDGDTSRDGLRRIDIDVLDKNPLLVIVEFGGNDFLKKLPKADTLENVSQMVDKIHAKGAMVAIADISAGMFFRDYRIALRKLAREKGAIFIPSILKGIITTPQLKSDFLHPNADGYVIVAKRVYRAILPYLKQNSALNKPKK